MCALPRFGTNTCPPRSLRVPAEPGRKRKNHPLRPGHPLHNIGYTDFVILAYSLALWMTNAQQKASFEESLRAKLAVLPVFVEKYEQEATDPNQSVTLAVWKEGRVVWRVGKVGPRPLESWPWYKGRYFEGVVPWQNVSNAIQAFRRANLSDDGGIQCYMWPTGTPLRLQFIDGKKFTTLALEQNGFVKPFKTPPVWKRFRASLIPKDGIEVEAPDSREWDCQSVFR